MSKLIIFSIISILIMYINYIILRYAKNKSYLIRLPIMLIVLFFIFVYGSFAREKFFYELIFAEKYLYNNFIINISIFIGICLIIMFGFI